MRKVLAVIAGFLVATALVAAQHMNTKETPVKGTLTVNSDVMLGTAVLNAGTYEYRCDRENITFANPNTGKTVLKLACKGKELPAASAETTMYTATDTSGKKTVTKLLLKGSNIEHVFQ